MYLEAAAEVQSELLRHWALLWAVLHEESARKPCLPRDSPGASEKTILCVSAVEGS